VLCVAVKPCPLASAQAGTLAPFARPVIVSAWNQAIVTGAVTLTSSEFRLSPFVLTAETA